jgi:PAS domain S-box-containing protein/putative nucleotidyltransferase with HDIG domain
MTAVKILIVEDEGIIAKSLKVVLEEFGYGISSITASGEEAIEKVKKDKPDLVLMDIMLKGDINGIEAAKRIKSDFNIPVIYLTAYTDKQILEQAKIAEPFGYIVKPFEDRELYSTIEMALYKNQMEKKIDRLNRMLRAFRNVNQLIIREKDRNILLQKACTHLIETQGYFSAWVALLDETNKLITTAEAGLGKDFLPMVSLLKHGKLPDCITKALVKTELVVIKDASSICRECPISEKYCSKGALTIRLQSNNKNNKIYGVLSVSIDLSLLPLDEELSLFTEVTEDIAFALRNIELEEGQKQAEEEMKRLASFSELSPLATVEIDKTGRINYINPAASRLLPDLSITGFAHPFLAGLESVFNTDQSMKQDILCREAQVKDIWFAQTIFSVDNGLHMRIYASEITKRKKAEQTLKESEEKYRSIFENSVEGIYQSTPEGRFISINPAMAHIYGYESPKEMIMSITNIGKQLYVDPKEKKRHKNLLEKYGIVENFEAQLYRKDGTIIWVSLSTRAVKDATGKVLYNEGIVEDITERKRAEIALIESESKFKNLVEESIAGVYIIQDGVFKYVNQRCAEIHGYTVEEMVDKLSPKETILPDDLPIVEENIRKRLSGETVTVHFTFRVVRKDKKVVHIEVYGSSMMYQGKPAIIGTLIDITERKLAEEELKQTLEKLRKSLGGTIRAMAATVETRDPYTAGHQKRVTHLARSIAQEMGLSKDTIEGIRMAGIIHDIGKISVPAEILSKPTKLTDMEFNLIKIHPQSGYDILKEIDFPWPIAQIVLQHHERMDGSGYPNLLKNGQIIVEAKILAVADVVESMASHRPYRPALGIDVALNEIEQNKGALYDTEAVEVCVRLFREKGFTFE